MRSQQCGEEMWKLCKELRGTESLNGRDYFSYSEIAGVNLRYGWALDRGAMRVL